MRRQPELRPIRARDPARLPFASIPFGFELINAFIKAFEEIGIVDLGGLPIRPHRIGEVLVIGVQSHNFVGPQRLAIGEQPLDTKDHAKDLAFFDDAALPKMLMIHPVWQCFSKLHLHAQLFPCRILAQNEGEAASRERVALERFVVLKGEPGALPGTELGPVDLIGPSSMLAVLVVSDGFGKAQSRIFQHRGVDYFNEGVLRFHARNQIAQAAFGVESQPNLVSSLLILGLAILLAQGIGLFEDLL
jgi:hypothetical protein